MRELLEYQSKISDLQYTIGLLSWELSLISSKESKEDLIKLMTKYEKKLHLLSTDSKYEKILIDTINSKEYNNLQEDEKRYIQNLYNNYNKFKKIPIDFYEEYSNHLERSKIKWEESKLKNDYSIFKPYLFKIVDLTKKYYRYLDDKTENLYDVMLNDYERGMNCEIIDSLFEDVKKEIIPLINKVSKKEKIINIDYSTDELLECAKYLLNYIGFDLDKGTLGIYPHGFTQKINSNDIRIAFDKTTNPIDFVSTIIHEGGHGIFEQNINSNLEKIDSSMIENLNALHESQSRFFENILGRNKNFWVPIYDDIKKMLKLDIDIDEFVSLLNNPSCTLIRTEADELTYCMHIILRYEIERDLINDKITVDDIPLLWKQKMKEYLGVEVTNDNEGLIQDVHWSQGNFGYFPDYLLGSIYDGMFLESIEKDLGNIDDLLKSGNIKKITKYLIDNIYVNGGAYNSIEVLNKICKKDLTSKPLIDYFYGKYNK